MAFVYVCVSSLFWILFFSLAAQKELIVSREWFRSTALRVMSPPRFPCATLLSTLSLSLSPSLLLPPHSLLLLYFTLQPRFVCICAIFPLAHRLTLSCNKKGRKEGRKHKDKACGHMNESNWTRKGEFLSFLFIFYRVNRREGNKNIGYGHTKRKAPLLARSVKLSLFGLG